MLMSFRDEQVEFCGKTVLLRCCRDALRMIVDDDALSMTDVITQTNDNLQEEVNESL